MIYIFFLTGRKERREQKRQNLLLK